jgi:hypothetical protein
MLAIMVLFSFLLCALLRPRASAHATQPLFRHCYKDFQILSLASVLVESSGQVRMAFVPTTPCTCLHHTCFFSC